MLACTVMEVITTLMAQIMTITIQAQKNSMQLPTPLMMPGKIKVEDVTDYSNKEDLNLSKAAIASLPTYFDMKTLETATLVENMKA